MASNRAVQMVAPHRPFASKPILPVQTSHTRCHVKARASRPLVQASITQPSKFLDRREAVIAAVAALVFPATASGPAMAESGFAIDTPSPKQEQVYTDDKDGFTISIPYGWEQGNGALGGPAPDSKMSRYSNAAGLQRVVAFFPSTAPDVNLAITVKPIGADFTSLGSFGTAADFGENLVASMDRSFLLRGRRRSKDPVTVAKLLEAKESSGRFIISYQVGKEGEPTRKVISAVAIGTTPSGMRRFFTVNGSCTEGAQEEEYFKMIRKSVESFKASTY